MKAATPELKKFLLEDNDKAEKDVVESHVKFLKGCALTLKSIKSLTHYLSLIRYDYLECTTVEDQLTVCKMISKLDNYSLW